MENNVRTQDMALSVDIIVVDVKKLLNIYISEMMTLGYLIALKKCACDCFELQLLKINHSLLELS